MMSNSKKEEYVFYGGSTEESVEAGCRSLGELIIKRLRENGDDVSYVSTRFIVFVVLEDQRNKRLQADQ